MYFPRHLAPLLPIHLPTVLFFVGGSFLRFVLMTMFQAKLSTLKFNVARPGPRNDTIADNGAMLDIGQERSK